MTDKTGEPTEEQSGATAETEPEKDTPEPRQTTTEAEESSTTLPGEPNLSKESERRKKLKATLALLRSAPDWKKFLVEQRNTLLQMREQLLPGMQNVTRDHLRSGEANVASSSGQHIGDAGSEAEQRDITILRLDKDRDLLFEIDSAIERIDKGLYGVCEDSLEPIPRKRLQVQPYCRYTVKCQEEREKKYKAMGSIRNANSRDVGFSGLQKVIGATNSLDEDDE